MKQRDRMTRIVRPLRGGQITIPAEFRKKLGITEDTMLQVILEDHELRIKAVEVRETAQGSPWLEELYEYFAPVREEIRATGASEQEVNDAIDAALKGVRQKHA